MGACTLLSGAFGWWFAALYWADPPTALYTGYTGSGILLELVWSKLVPGGFRLIPPILAAALGPLRPLGRLKVQFCLGFQVHLQLAVLRTVLIRVIRTQGAKGMVAPARFGDLGL